MKVFLITLLFVTSAFAGKIEWPKDKSAVAWKAKKRMFLVKTVEPVGINQRTWSNIFNGTV